MNGQAVATMAAALHANVIAGGPTAPAAMAANA